MTPCDLIKFIFPGLSSLVIEQVTDQGSVVRVVARTAGTPAACPQCGRLSDRLHAYHQRQLADLPVGGRE